MKLPTQAVSTITVVVVVQLELNGKLIKLTRINNLKPKFHQSY